MGAIQDVFGKEPDSVELADIERLVTNQVEERANLEYKAPDILARPPDLSEWVSSFLNAEGGVIVIGVREDKPTEKNNLSVRVFPTSIDYVGRDYTKERVEQLVFDNIRGSSRPAIRVVPVRDKSDPTKTVFLLEIPQGDNPPYQAANKKYYRRLNTTKYSMSHYEIADFFGRRRSPKLKLHCAVTNPLQPQTTDEREVRNRRSYSLQIAISNEGNGIAKYARSIVSFEGIEIKSVRNGAAQRIDNLRNGVPTLQWDNPLGVVYCGSRADVIWDLDVTLKKGEWGRITWETLAADAETTKGDWVLLGLEAVHLDGSTGSYYLKSHEEYFGRPHSPAIDAREKTE